MGKKINVPIPANDNEGEITKSHDGANDVRKVPGRYGGTLTPFDSTRAREAVRARVEKKREVIRQAAQEAVMNGALLGRFGSEAWLAEIAQSQYTLATTPDAGKSAVMAAQWLVNHAGMDEPKGRDGDSEGGVSAAADLVRALADFAAAMVLPADVIDADAS